MSDLDKQSKFPQKGPNKSRKRKSEGEDLDPSRSAKSIRKTYSKDDKDIDLTQYLNDSISRMDSGHLADYVARKTKRFGPNLTIIELEERRLPEKAIFDTSSWVKSRTLQNLPEYLETYSTPQLTKSELSSASNEVGSPHTLVITSAGLRAADVIRALRPFQTKEAAVAKLFAKHIKMQEAIEFLKSRRVCMGVGTPSRVFALLDSGALSLSHLRRVVIDCSHVDQKQRNIFDMRDTVEPLIRLLNRPDIKERYGRAQDDVHLLFY